MRTNRPLMMAALAGLLMPLASVGPRVALQRRDDPPDLRPIGLDIGGGGLGLRKTTLFKPNGVRECARRRRQIARGQLTASNGLVSP